MLASNVADRPKRVKTGHGRSASRFSGSDAPRDRSKARRQYRKDRQDAALHARRKHGWKATRDPLVKGSGYDAPLWSIGLGSTHTGERRREPRQTRLILSDQQREVCRRGLAAAGACGSGYRAFRRYIKTPTGFKEERLVSQTFCGSRFCERCDAEIRRRECWRVEGGWRMFLTFGMPSAGLTPRQGWRRIRVALALLIKRLERHAGRPDSWAVRVWDEDADAASNHRAWTRFGRQRKSKLDYAWCLEPHVSGFPHVHMVVNACYIDYSWFRKVWSECLGMHCRWFLAKRVKSQDGICRYLSKYISKTVFTPDLCAVNYRRRMWATSRPLPPEKWPEWVAETETTPGQAADQAHEPAAFDARQGWTKTGGAAGRYQTWSRDWPLLDGIDRYLFERHVLWRFEEDRRCHVRPRSPPESEESWAPIADLLTYVAYKYISGQWTLTGLDKVGHTFASES